MIGMNWRRTAIFFLVLIVIAGFYYFRIRLPYPSDAPLSFSPEPRNAFILSLAPKESVEKIKIQSLANDNVEIVLHRLNEHDWQITKPVNYPAESLIINGFVTLLKLTPRVRPLSFNSVNEKEFGFDIPQISICVSTNLRSKERCLLIGVPAAIVSGFYAKWKDEPQYFLLDRNAFDALDKGLYSLRQKQVFMLLDREVDTLHFKSAEKEIEMKQVEKIWRRTKPTKAALSEDKVNEVLVGLNGLYAKEFIDGKTWDQPEFGLRPPQQTIQIVFKDGSQVTLLRGKEAVGKDAYYALGEDPKTVFLISTKKFKNVEVGFQKLV